MDASSLSLGQNVWSMSERLLSVFGRSFIMRSDADTSGCIEVLVQEVDVLKIGEYFRSHLMFFDY